MAHAETLSIVKRKHETITPIKGLKRSYQPLERRCRLKWMPFETVRLARPSEENRAIPSDEAMETPCSCRRLWMKATHTDVSLSPIFRGCACQRLGRFLKCMEKNTFLMNLDENMQKTTEESLKRRKGFGGNGSREEEVSIWQQQQKRLFLSPWMWGFL
jgi:hypothetical protein